MVSVLVNVREEMWLEDRFIVFCDAMGYSRMQGVGLLILFWANTRAREMVSGRAAVIKEYLSGDTKEQKNQLLKAMTEAGYLKQTFNDNYVIEGNAEFNELLQKKRSNAKLGRSQFVANIVRKHAREGKGVKPTTACWERYRASFMKRYGVEPVRNAKVNTTLTQLVARLGQTDAPEVLAYFVDEVEVYTKNKHDLQAALQDAELLHVKWQSFLAGGWNHEKAVRKRGQQLEAFDAQAMEQR